MYRVRSIELKLLFSSSDPGPTSSSQPATRLVENLPESPAEVRLIELPAPNAIIGPPDAIRAHGKPWTFKSESITNYDGRACGIAHGAMWTWSAKDQDPCLLHGAVVVKHPSCPFLVECSVSGSASKPAKRDHRRARRRFRFSSDSRHWYLNPQPPETDLSQFESAIRELDTRIRQLNLTGHGCKWLHKERRPGSLLTVTAGVHLVHPPDVPGVPISSFSSREPPANTIPLPLHTINSSGSRSYGNSVFLGTSTVLMGDPQHTVHNYHPGNRGGT